MSKSKPGFTPAESRPEGLSIAFQCAPTMKIADLRRQPDLQCRAAGVNKRTAAAYSAAMQAGAAFPPVVVFADADGVHWLADGFHRCAAAELAGLTEIAVEVRSGGEADALLHAASANAEHGRQRSTEDKRRAVLALQARPEWSERGVRWIAEQCRVSPTFASGVIKTVHGGQLPATKGKDGKVRKPKRTRQQAKAAPDLCSLYVQTLRTHSKGKAAEHVAALVRAILRLNAGTTEQIVLWVQMSKPDPAPPLARVTPRRRIVQPPAATNGGE